MLTREILDQRENPSADDTHQIIYLYISSLLEDGPCQESMRKFSISNPSQDTLNLCQEIPTLLGVVPTLLGVVVQCMQEEPTAQTRNFNYKKSLLLKQVIYYYFLLSSILSIEPITVRPCRLAHNPWITQKNLGNEFSFTYAVLYSTSHFVLYVAYNYFSSMLIHTMIKENSIPL